MNRFRHLQVSNLYFRIMWIITLFLYIFIPLGSGLMSALYLGIIFLSVASFLATVLLLLKNYPSQFDSKALVLFLLILFELFLSLYVGKGNNPIKDVAINSLGYLEMMMALIILNQLQYTKRNTDFLLKVNIIIAIIFILLSRSKFAYSGRLPLLYLGYSNPNTTAIYLLLNQAILIMFVGAIKKKWIKCGVLLLSIYEVYLISLTGSRTCLVASLLIFIFYLSGKKIHVPKVLIIFAIIFPLLFVVFYTGLYASRQYTNTMFLGKELFSGRERLFYEIVTELKDSFILGDVKYYNFANSHNGPLTIISNLGIVGYFLFIVYYLFFIFSYYKKNSSTQQNIALMVILATFFHSASEAVLMVGGAQYSIIVATLYWILKGNSQDSEKELK